MLQIEPLQPGTNPPTRYSMFGLWHDLGINPLANAPNLVAYYGMLVSIGLKPPASDASSPRPPSRELRERANLPRLEPYA